MKASKEKLAKFLRDNLSRRKEATNKDVTKGPIDKFNSWHSEAKNLVEDPSRMVLATSTNSGIPSVRVVLLKHYDESGFVFYTNLSSRKSRELLENPNAALLFDWGKRQVRIEGSVKLVSNLQADQYFDSRPTDSKIVSILSKQSQILEDRTVFEKRIAKYKINNEEGSLKRPDYWSGFIIYPHTIEFWASGEARNHTRDLYKLNDENNWVMSQLYP